MTLSRRTKQEPTSPAGFGLLKTLWPGLSALAAIFFGLAGILLGLGPSSPAQAQSRVLLEQQGFPMAFLNGHHVVTFEERPERVLTLGLGATELFVELGLEDLIVGKALLSPKARPLPKYAQAFSTIPRVEQDDIFRLELEENGPDMLYGRYDPEVPEPVFVKTYHTNAKNAAQFFMEVRDLAKLFSVQDKAEAFIAEQSQKVDALERRISALSQVSVLIVRNVGDGSFSTYGGQDYVNHLLTLAKGKNVFAHLAQGETADAREAVDLNPRFVLLVDDGERSMEDKLFALKSDPVLSSLSAVSDNRLFSVEEAYLLPGPRLAESAELLVRRLHPSRFD